VLEVLWCLRRHTGRHTGRLKGPPRPTSAAGPEMARVSVYQYVSMQALFDLLDNE
jgi:hypothetical protein